MNETIVFVIALVVLQTINLAIISRTNGRSVNEAARRAADTARKAADRRFDKISPWMKGFDPSKIPAGMNTAEAEDEEEE